MISINGFSEILADVKQRGDAAVLHWTNTFDKLGATNIEALAKAMK